MNAVRDRDRTGRRSRGDAAAPPPRSTRLAAWLRRVLKTEPPRARQQAMFTGTWDVDVQGTLYQHAWATNGINGTVTDTFRTTSVSSGDPYFATICSTDYSISTSGILEQSTDGGTTWAYAATLSCGNQDWTI
eukprot:4072332-Prymnesium_polylepis.1